MRIQPVWALLFLSDLEAVGQYRSKPFDVPRLFQAFSF